MPDFRFLLKGIDDKSYGKICSFLNDYANTCDRYISARYIQKTLNISWWTVVAVLEYLHKKNKLSVVVTDKQRKYYRWVVTQPCNAKQKKKVNQ